MTETDLSGWLPIGDAAHMIGCSTRTVERLARARKLEQRLRPQAGSPAVAVFNPDDVARIASERRQRPAPFVLPAVGAGNGNGAGTSTLRHPEHRDSTTGLVPAGDDPIRQLFAAALRAVLSPPSPPVAESVAETLSPEERAAQYVTLAEASAIKHLSQAYLRRQVEAGTLKAVRDRGWRIRRKDLEAL